MIYELFGIIVLGASIAPTLHKKNAEIHMSGILMALISASVMVAGASFFALPVSTVHTIIGSIGGT